MESWEPRKDRGHPVLTLGNRYVSTGNDKDHQQVSIEMEAIDPFRILQGAVPSAIHSKENQVLYFERITRGTRCAPSYHCTESHTYATVRRTAYDSVGPSLVRVGQIVELQAGFGAILTKKNKYVLLPILRSICIMDRTVQEVGLPTLFTWRCLKERGQDLSKAALDGLRTALESSSTSLKRQVGYDSSESDVSKQLKRLKMDEEEDDMDDDL